MMRKISFEDMIMGVALLSGFAIICFRLRSGSKPNPEELKSAREEWYKENAPFGKELGYPECCIKEFCDMPPEFLNKIWNKKQDQLRYNAACIDNKYTGFIPCIAHARMIINNEIKLQDLIKNRNAEFPAFPNY